MPPYFSVVMPVYRPAAHLLAAAIQSVKDQTFTDWELVAVDDGSDQEAVRSVLSASATSDTRILHLERPANEGIVAATNDALEACSGEFVAFMDHDDLLEPDALEACATAIARTPECDILYTDEAGVDVDDRPLGAFLKPDWSPERLMGQNYVNHLSVYRRALVAELGGMRAGFDGSQDYDLLLRASERARRIVHVPRVLYHWRVLEGQVSGSGRQSVFDAARRAISEHCERTGIDARVEQIEPRGVYRLHRKVRGNPLVSVVIPTRGSRGEVWGRERVFVTETVRSILTTSSYRPLEVVVVADTATPPEVIDELAEVGGPCLKTVWYERPFNFSHKINVGVAASSGSYLVLLNDDMEVITPDWTETLLGIVQQDDVAAAGAALYFEDGTYQHAGHLYANKTALGHIGYRVNPDHPGPAMAYLLDRECSGVTAACMAIHRDDFYAVGGLCRLLPFNYNDVDFSLKLRTLGKRIVFTPFAKLYHFESKSRVRDITTSEWEMVQQRWGRRLDRGDPYWRYPADA